MKGARVVAGLAGLLGLAVSVAAQDGSVSLQWQTARGAMAPAVAAGPRGVWLSWLEPHVTEEGGRGHRLRVAKIAGNAVGKATTVRAGNDFFANWADLPGVTAAGDGRLLAHWLQRGGASTYAYEVHLAESADGGESWQARGRLHGGDAPVQHGFVSMVAAGDGLRAFWLDGRVTEQDAAATGAKMTLRTAMVGDPDSEEIVDGDVCSCCPTAAVAVGDGVLVAYRDRTRGEVRDIALVRHAADGFDGPRPVAGEGWHMPACPVNGPSVAAAADEVVVAWYTGAGGGRVLACRSTDAGKSFAAPVVVDDGDPVGRVSMAFAAGVPVVCWLGRDGDRAALRLARLGDTGVAPPLTLAHVAPSRRSGTPRMVAREGALFVVWRQPSATEGGLRAARVPLAALPPISARD